MGYIDSTLSGDEKVEYTFSYHWIKWVVPIVLCITIYLIPIGIYLILKIKFTEQAVTSKKGVKKEGIIGRNTEELLLQKVETVEITQGVLGRILSYGDIQLTGTGNSILVFSTISNPMDVKKNIESLLDN